MEMLQVYPWPGNIGELENEISRAAALAEAGLPIQSYHFSPEVTQGESLIQDALLERRNYKELVDSFQQRLV